MMVKIMVIMMVTMVTIVMMIDDSFEVRQEEGFRCKDNIESMGLAIFPGPIEAMDSCHPYRRS